MTATPSPPTRVRYLVLGSAVLMSLILYIDRFCLSFVRSYMGADLGVDQATIGTLFSCFFFLYGIGQVPAGWFSDRIGSRKALTIYILAWSLFTGLVGLANGMVALAICFAGLGLAQAGAYPTAGSMIGKWMPLSNRAVASSLVGLGGRFGGALVFILSASLMLLFVPLGTPVEFQASDIRQPNALALKLAPKEEAKPSAESFLWNHLPTQSQKALLEIAENAKPFEALDEQARAGKVAPKPSTEQVTEVVAGLNFLVKSKTLTGERIEPTHPFALLAKLPDEAVALIRKKNDGTAWSDQETERFNRFVIEAVTGGSVRQIFEQGWRPVFWVMGFTGVFVAGIVWLAFRDHPREHPWVNASELELIEAGRTEKAVSRATGGIPVVALISSPGMWCNSIMQFAINIGWLLLQTEVARYLLEIHDVPIEQRARLAMMPPLAGIAGLFLGGIITDALTRRIGLGWGRRLPMVVTKIGCIAAFLSLPFLKDPISVTVAFSLAYFFTDLGISAVWAYAQDVGGKHVGSVLGFGNMWGNIGASVAPLVYLAVLGKKPLIGDWNNLFLVAAVACAIAGLASLGVDSTKQVFKDDLPEPEPGPAGH